MIRPRSLRRCDIIEIDRLNIKDLVHLGVEDLKHHDPKRNPHGLGGVYFAYHVDENLDHHDY